MQRDVKQCCILLVCMLTTDLCGYGRLSPQQAQFRPDQSTFLFNVRDGLHLNLHLLLLGGWITVIE